MSGPRGECSRTVAATLRYSRRSSARRRAPRPSRDAARRGAWTTPPRAGCLWTATTLAFGVSATLRKWCPWDGSALFSASHAGFSRRRPCVRAPSPASGRLAWTTRHTHPPRGARCAGGWSRPVPDARARNHEIQGPYALRRCQSLLSHGTSTSLGVAHVHLGARRGGRASPPRVLLLSRALDDHLRARGGVAGRDPANRGFLSTGLSTWKEHMRFSSTLIMAPQLSNSPQ
mmetsp:Transcript_9889/g.29076  ORF Transcript_9889/g.29076 Transcript_9889/m.29076 type:complete len:231 (-) Transcript_9889:899-1591(-)